MRVRTHVAGETYASLERAGYSRREVDRQVAYGHLSASNGRVRYVHTDPIEETA
ncbi:hypothetical protein [Rhodococcoides yunnanense]|uniref:hypothetical protein n=1 Tax=Rhodococcoides yunnanense TaxID=278209 RepID=UPI0012E10989|nr:hypothetical protein [Rhodococcus yunnanensis]